MEHMDPWISQHCFVGIAILAFCFVGSVDFSALFRWIRNFNALFCCIRGFFSFDCWIHYIFFCVAYVVEAFNSMWQASGMPLQK